MAKQVRRGLWVGLALMAATVTVARAEPLVPSSSLGALVDRILPEQNPTARGAALLGIAVAVTAAFGWQTFRHVRQRRALRRMRNHRGQAPTTDGVQAVGDEQRERDLLSFFVNFPEQVKALNSSLALDEVAEVVGSACHAMLGATRVQVFLLNESSDELRLVHARAPGENLQVFHDARVTTQDLPQSWLLGQLRPATSSEVEVRAPRPGAVMQVHGHCFPFQLATTVFLRGEARGLITVGGIPSPNEHTRQILSCLANVAAISLENAQHMERALHLADLDRMTELYNHAYFQRQLAREVDEARRAGADVSIFLLDLDHFKNYNDREGHPAGDALLKRLARILDSNVRVSDLVARYGGEEFVVLMPGTNEAEATALAEHLRALVAQQSFPGGAAQPTGGVTLSGGVTSLAAGASSASDMVKRADVALYRAKQLGRNRVQAFAPEFELDRRRGDRRLVAVQTPIRATVVRKRPGPRIGKVRISQAADVATDDVDQGA